MPEQNHPTFGNGKICYLEIPATDIQQSAEFYENVFGWKIRKDNLGNASFDDGVGEVSGMWVRDRNPQSGEGIMISIMVTDINATINLIKSNGGKIIREAARNSPELVALFSDPSGNVLSLYQHSR